MNRVTYDDILESNDSIVQTYEFTYIGKNIAILLKLRYDTLHLKVLRMNTKHENGDIYCSDFSFMDYSDKKFGYLSLPLDIVKYRPFTTKYENVSLAVFNQFCEVIAYFDLHGKTYD